MSREIRHTCAPLQPQFSFPSGASLQKMMTCCATIFSVTPRPPRAIFLLTWDTARVFPPGLTQLLVLYTFCTQCTHADRGTSQLQVTALI